MAAGNLTKQKILDTALDLFSTHGFSGTSIRDIAKIVGIRESSIYNHFESKQNILTSLHSQFNSITGTALITNDLLDKMESPNHFLKLFVQRIIKIWMEKREIKFFNLLLKESDISSLQTNTLDSFISEFRELWIKIFSQLIKFSYIKKVDPEAIANQFLAFLLLFRIEHLRGSEIKSEKKLLLQAEKQVDLFWDVIRIK